MKKTPLIIGIVLVIMGLLAYNKMNPSGISKLKTQAIQLFQKEEVKKRAEEEKEEPKQDVAQIQIGTQTYPYHDEAQLAERLGTQAVEEALFEEMIRQYSPSKGDKEAEAYVEEKESEYRLVGIKKPKAKISEEVYRVLGIRNLVDDTIGVSETLRHQYEGKKVEYKVYTYQESVKVIQKREVKGRIDRSIRQIKAYHKKGVSPKEKYEVYQKERIQDTEIGEILNKKEAGEVGIMYDRGKQEVTYYYLAEKRVDLDYSDREIAEIEINQLVKGSYAIGNYRRLLEAIESKASKIQLPPSYRASVHTKEEAVITHKEDDIAYNVQTEIGNAYRMLAQLDR